MSLAKILVAQGGGPTAVINQSLVGVVLEARRQPGVGLVYGACFVVLLVFAAVARVPLGAQPPRELAIFVALALGPMLLGHTGLNWALRYVPAYVVNLTLLGEPVGATLIAAALPGIRELPSGATVAGGALILAGVYVAARNAASARTPPISSDVVETFPSHRAD